MRINKWKPYIIRIVDAILVVLSLGIASMFGFAEDIGNQISTVLLCGLAIQAVVYSVFLYSLNIYKIMWYYSSLQEMFKLILAGLLSQMVSYVIHMSIGISLTNGVSPLAFLRVHAVAGVTSLSFLVLSRAVLYVVERRKGVHDLDGSPSTKKPKNTMVIGAGGACHLFLYDINNNNHKDEYAVKCIIDDSPAKQGMLLGDVPVVGGRDTIEKNVRKYNIELIVYAIPSSTPAEKAEILSICSKTNCQVKTMPALYQTVGKEDLGALVKQIRNVEIEDLLGRDPIKVNLESIMDYVKGKVILVTGGGGSIGSELCRQIAANHPKRLIIFDIYENNAYDIRCELKRNHPELDLEVLIGSVRDNKRLDNIFDRFRPDIVYHAAAHKHVPLMEDSPNEAIKNNVFGTFNTVQMADKYEVKRFVLISTDKAVNPTNIMGASKRICEMIVQSYNRFSKTEFVAVRFGNVLGSNGSVIPLFKKQISEGGPVTVTHPDIIRYFMTIPEAVSLVLQAGASAKGGEIFVLDMGQPVKILSLAENLIRLSGYEPYKDIDIQFTGLRPGEKLYEELLMSEEGLKSTENKLIYIGKPIEFDEEHFFTTMHEMKHNMENDSFDMRLLVKKIVPTYKMKD